MSVEEEGYLRFETLTHVADVLVVTLHQACPLEARATGTTRFHLDMVRPRLLGRDHQPHFREPGGYRAGQLLAHQRLTRLRIVQIKD